jgi:AmmeMemoRadiSam system protein A
MNFDEKEKVLLHSIARNAISGQNPTDNLTASLKNPTDNLTTECGVFVTLKKGGDLRGCIGFTQSDRPLYEEVAHAAELAAFHDYRFDRVSPEELDEIDIEISVLSPMRLVKDVSQIELGQHGILVVKGERSGLFLPQVAEETGWSLDDFLGHCARDKAGIGWDGWKSAEIYVFTVTVL